ncbi:3143_t:CDS:1, partial [Funneliformis geosporum]
HIDLLSHLNPCSDNNYQYNLTVEDRFDDWISVDTFMHQYCLERCFGYQIFRNDKEHDPTIIRRKSFRCSSNGNYKSRKIEITSPT